MFRNTILGVTVALMFAYAIAEARDDDTTKDLEKLQGTWMLIAKEEDGRDVPFDSDNLIIKGEKYAFVGYSDWVGTHKLDATKNPKTIDITPSREETQRGLYQIDADVYKTCFSKGMSVRPTKFSSKGGTIWTWKRVR
jgi:uncharacterized protein (TIGR03067 family)